MFLQVPKALEISSTMSMTQQQSQASKTLTQDKTETFVALKTPLSIGQELNSTQAIKLEADEVNSESATLLKEPYKPSKNISVPIIQGVRRKNTISSYFFLNAIKWAR